MKPGHRKSYKWGYATPHISWADRKQYIISRVSQDMYCRFQKPKGGSQYYDDCVRLIKEGVLYIYKETYGYTTATKSYLRLVNPLPKPPDPIKSEPYKNRKEGIKQFKEANEPLRTR